MKSKTNLERVVYWLRPFLYFQKKKYENILCSSTFVLKKQNSNIRFLETTDNTNKSLLKLLSEEKEGRNNVIIQKSTITEKKQYEEVNKKDLLDYSCGISIDIKRKTINNIKGNSTIKNNNNNNNDKKEETNKKKEIDKKKEENKKEKKKEKGREKKVSDNNTVTKVWKEKKKTSNSNLTICNVEHNKNKENNKINKKIPSKKKEEKKEEKKKKKNGKEDKTKDKEKTNCTKKKNKKEAKSSAKKKDIAPVLNIHTFNKEEYFKEFEKKKFQNDNIILKQIKNVGDIKVFFTTYCSSLHFKNIYAYNNFLYEIYDKFSNSEIRKVKKIIKNYNGLTKINLKTRIKYAEHFYKICPTDYNEILTCLFIQSIDILKVEDVSNTFYYDKILNAKENDGDNEGEEMHEKDNENNVEEYLFNERKNDEAKEIIGLREAHRCIEMNIDKDYEGTYVHTSDVNSYRNKSMYHKNVYEICVHFNNMQTSINEKKFVIVYDLPIINYDLLINELKKTFSFCGAIQNIEIRDEILRSADRHVLNMRVESGLSEEKYEMNENDDANITAETKTEGNLKTTKKNNKNKKKSSKKKNVDDFLSPSNPTRLYGIIEFENEKGAELATSEYIRIFGIFCYNKLIYVDKCENKKLMVITHLPFDLNIYHILYLLLNASLLDISFFSQNEQSMKKTTMQKHIGHISRNSFHLKNSNIKIENMSDIFNYNISNNCDPYNLVYEVSKKNFEELEERIKKNIQNVDNFHNINEININGIKHDTNKNYENFFNFYQNMGEIKEKATTFVNNNNGRTLLLHFDNFSCLLECIRKFLYIFKDKNCMKFSLNLKRCIYMDGMIQDYISLKNTSSHLFMKNKELHIS